MELQQLRYVLAVRTFGNFTKAAESLYVSQSALSQQIQRIEGELGVKLFERTSHSLTVTEAGEIFSLQAREVLRTFNRMNEVMEQYRAENRQRITILTTIRLRTVDLPDAIGAFYQEHPEISLTYNCRPAMDLKDWFALENWDVAILRTPLATELFNSSEFECIPLLREEICALVGESHPFARRDFVTADEIRGQCLVKGPEGFPIYEPQIVSYNDCSSPGLTSTSYDIMASLVKRGNCIAVGHRSTANSFGLKAVRIVPQNYGVLYLFCPVHSRRKEPVELLVEHLKEYYKRWGEEHKLTD